VVGPTWDAVILSSAAVTAAVIAAWTANHRTGKQLDAEADRLQRQLDAEAKRLDRQLAQDSSKHERSELRELLDEGAVLVNDTWTCFRAMNEEGPMNEEEMANRYEGKPQLRPAIKAAPDLIRELEDYWHRLMLRFNVFDGMTVSVEAMTDVFRDALVLYEVRHDLVDADRKDEFLVLMEKFEDAHAEFVGECQERFGTTNFRMIPGRTPAVPPKTDP
jgi:hypothetical protein